VKYSKAIPVTGHRIVKCNQLIDGSDVSIVHWLPYPSGGFLALISVTGCIDPRAIVRLEGLGQLKNPQRDLNPRPSDLKHIIILANVLLAMFMCSL
jgi:hypothetical protein